MRGHPQLRRSRRILSSRRLVPRKSATLEEKGNFQPWNAPTVLVNAAGGNDPRATVTQENPFEEISSESWSSCFDLNVSGSVLLPCQEFGPAMCAAGKGSIINIASVAGHIPLSRVVAYSAAKAAVVSLTNFLRANGDATECASTRSPLVSFPRSKTVAFSSRRTAPRPREPLSILDHTPMGRFGEAQELGGAVVFLASDVGKRLRYRSGYPRRRRLPFPDDLICWLLAA